MNDRVHECHPHHDNGYRLFDTFSISSRTLTLFSMQIHGIESVGAHFTVENTKAQVHTAGEAFKPTFELPTI